MPVAPSFATYKRISAEPFLKNGKYYITVENPSNGHQRDVRYYTDAEFAKVYGKKIKSVGEDGFDNLKQSRGFSKGPILAIRNIKPADEDWLKASCARYAVGIGWHIVSTDTFPDDAPSHFKYIPLGWKEASIDDRHFKSANELASIISEKARKKEFLAIS